MPLLLINNNHFSVLDIETTKDTEESDTDVQKIENSDLPTPTPTDRKPPRRPR